MDYLEAATTRHVPRRVREDAEQPSLLEISDLNPLAQRRPGGIWNEHILPVTEWEAAEHRLVLPGDLQPALGLPSPVLRWDAAKLAKVRRVHPETNDLAVTMSEFINMWKFAGPQPSKANTWNVFFPHKCGWFIAVLAIRRRDSYNIVSMYRPRIDWLERRTAHGDRERVWIWKK